jgi:hypothetical protein
MFFCFIKDQVLEVRYLTFCCIWSYIYAVLTMCTFENEKLKFVISLRRFWPCGLFSFSWSLSFGPRSQFKMSMNFVISWPRLWPSVLLFVFRVIAIKFRNWCRALDKELNFGSGHIFILWPSLLFLVISCS